MMNSSFRSKLPDDQQNSRAQPIVYVVDDDISVRESLELLIGHEGWQVVSCSSAEAFLDRGRALVPGCIVLDVSLPDLNGLDLQARIAADRHALPIIFITGYGDVPMTVRAMKAGATEFLTKPFDDDELVTAIANAIARSRERLAKQADVESIRARHASLTPREREVMALVVAGLLNKQVGAELGISEITVKAHRGQVMRKMQVRSVPALVKLAASLEASSPSAGGGAHKDV